MISIFLRGLALGFAIAAPVGPIGVLVIRRTLAEGRLAGLISGLGAATADGIYGCIAAFGLTFISSFLISQQNWIRLLGGLFLLYLGVKHIRLGPTLPAFVSPGVLKVLVEQFDLKPIATVEEDLAAIAAGH